MKKILLVLVSIVMSFFTFASTKEIKIATVSIFPMNKIVEIAKEDLEKKGYKVSVLHFSDYKTPNIALNSKEVDVNFIQHKPYMEFFKANGLKNLKYVEPVYNVYIGFYSKDSKKLKNNLDNLKEKAIVFLSADPVNKSWGLSILEENGLIKLDHSKNSFSEKDIIENKKNLVFKFLPPSTIHTAYKEADLVFSWPSGMLKLGVSPEEAVIKVKDENNVYAVSVVSREDNNNSNEVKEFIKSIKSKKVKEFLEKEYKKEGYPVF